MLHRLRKCNRNVRFSDLRKIREYRKDVFEMTRGKWGDMVNVAIQLSAKYRDDEDMYKFLLEFIKKIHPVELEFRRWIKYIQGTPRLMEAFEKIHGNN